MAHLPQPSIDTYPARPNKALLVRPALNEVIASTAGSLAERFFNNQSMKPSP